MEEKLVQPTTDAKSPKQKPLLIIGLTVSVILLLGATGFITYQNYKLKKQVSQTQTTTPLEVTKTIPSSDDSRSENQPNGYFNFTNELHGWSRIARTNSSFCRNQTIDIFYFPSDQQLKLPDLLSNYKFIAIRSNPSVAPALNYKFPKEFYNIKDAFDNGQISGAFYEDKNGGIWLQAEIKLEQFNLTPNERGYSAEYIGDLVFAHASSIEEILDLVEDAGEIKFNEEGWYIPDSRLKQIPIEEKFSPNTTDSSGKYRYYVPTGYTRSVPTEGDSTVTVWKSGPEKRLCMVLEEVSKTTESCWFSTSGCTCCNTGCGLLDFIIYKPIIGDIKIEEILQKGTNGSMGPRFVYEGKHPWILSASFYSDDNNDYTDVLDIVFMAESIEKVQ